MSHRAGRTLGVALIGLLLVVASIPTAAGAASSAGSAANPIRLSAAGQQSAPELQILADALEDATGLVDKDGPVKFTGWISNTEGYVLLEADTKAEVIGICAQFWPLFHNDIMEIVPVAEAAPAILAGVKKGWEKR